MLVIVVRRPNPYPGRAAYASTRPPACIFGAPFSSLYRTTTEELVPDGQATTRYPFEAEILP